MVLCLLMIAETSDAQRRRTRTRSRQRTTAVRSSGGNHHQQRLAEFEREGGIDSTTIVMLGNSLTENGKDWTARIGTTKKVVNRGIIGDNTVGMTERLRQITPYHPRAIFLMAGINDMVGNTTYDSSKPSVRSRPRPRYSYRAFSLSMSLTAAGRPLLAAPTTFPSPICSSKPIARLTTSPSSTSFRVWYVDIRTCSALSLPTMVCI